MKKSNNDVLITFDDYCEWNGSELLEAYIKEIFAHAKIIATEISVENIRYDNGEEATLLVKELDEASGVLIEKEYCVHLFEDCATTECYMFAHFLWQVDDCDLTLIDQAIYQVFPKGQGKYTCLCIAEET